jgi:hypothetical protein
MSRLRSTELHRGIVGEYKANNYTTSIRRSMPLRNGIR